MGNQEAPTLTPEMTEEERQAAEALAQQAEEAEQQLEQVQDMLSELPEDVRTEIIARYEDAGGAAIAAASKNN